MQYVLIIHVDGDCTTANLFLGKFQTQHLVVWKGHLLQHDNVAVILLETDTTVQHKGRLQFYGLDIGSLLLFLVLQFYTQLVYIEGEIGLVLDRKVDEEIFSYDIDIVQAHCKLVLLGESAVVAIRKAPALNALL